MKIELPKLDVPANLTPMPNFDAIKGFDEHFSSLEARIKELETTIAIASEKNWVEKNPVSFGVLMAVISAIVATGVTIIAIGLHLL